MSRKVEKGNIKDLNPYSSVSWNKGRRTVTKSYVETDRHGELRRITISRSLNVLGLVFVLIFISTIAAILVGSEEPKTFATFLEMLTTVPKIEIPWFAIQEYALSFPDWLAWLQPIVEFFQQLLSVGLFFLNGIWQGMLIVVWVMRWLFL